MKKLSALSYALSCITVISCMHHHGNIDISSKDSDKYYSMNAYFSKNKTRYVENIWIAGLAEEVKCLL